MGSRFRVIRPLSGKQSFGIYVLAILLLCVILYRFYTSRNVSENLLYLDRTSPVSLINGMNPNTASWAELSQLPGIGESKARAIVNYRDSHITNGRGAIVFSTADDLQNVKGIGKTTVNEIKEFLIFDKPKGNL